MAAMVWLPVAGWEDYYEVSNTGLVRSIERHVPHGRHGTVFIRERILKHSTNGGYRQVKLCGGGSSQTRRVHQLVLEAFIGPRPPAMDGCHNDGDPSNNHVANLRWDTRSSNMFDAVKHGTHQWARMTHCKKGHEYTSENTRITGNYRTCRTCINERERAERAPHIKPPPPHCPQGHEFTPENTHFHGTTGYRQCRECSRIWSRRYHASRKAGVA